MSASRDLGILGEDLACDFLKKNGYKILTRNFRSKFGEIDIVAQEKDTLVFVEVKTRWSKSFGPPEEAITPWKVRKMIKASQYYKLLHPCSLELMRLDAVAIEMDSAGRLERIEIIKNLSQF